MLLLPCKEAALPWSGSVYKRIVIAMLIKAWQFSFCNCDLVNPPLVHDLKRCQFILIPYSIGQTKWLFLSPFAYSGQGWFTKGDVDCVPSAC